MLFLQANAAVLVEQQNIQMMLLLWMHLAAGRTRRLKKTLDKSLVAGQA